MDMFLASLLVSLCVVAYLVLGMLCSETLLEDTLRGVSKKHRPIVRMMAVIGWPLVLIGGAFVSMFMYMFGEWFD